jgi:glucose-1-phosphate cytidylyltransferase
VKVVVLCGGLGTRLREETEFRPKRLVDIGGRPILWQIMKTYIHRRFRDVPGRLPDNEEEELV